MILPSGKFCKKIIGATSSLAAILIEPPRREKLVSFGAVKVARLAPIFLASEKRAPSSAREICGFLPKTARYSMGILYHKYGIIWVWL